MPLDLNPNTYLTVDEDQGTPVNDADEVAFAAGAGLVTYNAALATAALSVTGAAATSTFTTPQLAVQDDVFTFDANTTNLALVTAAGTAYPTTAGQGIDSGLDTVGGASIYLFQGPNENIVVGRVANDPTAAAAFVIVLDENTSGGFVTDAKMWIIQYAALLHDGQNVVEGDLLDLTNKVYVAAATVQSGIASDFSDVPAGAPIFAMIADDDDGPTQFLASAFNRDNPATAGTDESLTPITVNVSNQGSFPGSLASGSQNMTPGTGLRFDLVTDGDTTYSSNEGKLASSIVFTDHTEASRAGFTVVQNQGSRPTDILLQAYDVATAAEDSDGQAFFDDLDEQSLVIIDDVRVGLIDPATGASQTIYDSRDGITSADILTVTGLGTTSVTINDVLLNYEVEIISDAGFERFTVTNVSPESNAYIDVGRLTYTSPDVIITDTQEIGSRIQVDDSGPTVQVTGTAPELSVDDTGLPAGTVPDATELTDSGSVAANFSHTQGADGATLAYSLEVTNGTDSQLNDSLTGEDILLRKTIAGVVEGYTETTNLVVFNVSISAAGSLTLNLLRAIEHPDGGVVDQSISMGANLIMARATVTDSEGATTGDSVYAELSISDALNFEDDEPTVDGDDPTGVLLTTDDDVLGALGAASASYAGQFDEAFGADQGSGIGFALGVSSQNVASGLYDCGTGQSVLLKTSAGTVVGYVTINAVQTPVFTLAVDSSGLVTLTQHRAIEHLIGGVPTDTALGLTSADLITLTGTINDGDEDQAQATIDIGASLAFADAQPTLTTPDDLTILFADGESGSKSFTVDYNNDLPGENVVIDQFSYSGPYTVDPVSGTRVDFYDGSTLVYHLEVSNTGYTVTVDDAPSGEPTPLNFEGIDPGGPREILSVPLLDATDSIVFDGLIFTNPDPKSPLNNPAGDADYLNPDSLGFGVKQGQASQINPNEGFRFETASNIANVATGQQLSSLDFHVQGIGNLDAVTVTYWLYDDQGTASTADDTLLLTDSIDISGLRGGNVTQPVSISGATFDYAYVRFDFQGGNTNQGIRVEDFSATIANPVDPDSFQFSLKAEDCDGDQVFAPASGDDPAMITVTLDPTFGI